MSILNPESGRNIKIGGKVHFDLIKKGILDRDTLEQDTISIFNGSRQKMPKVKLEQYQKSTHWVNSFEISQSIGCSVFEIIEWFTKEFNEMKICYKDKSIRIIFPSKEFFIQEVIHDFIKDYSKKNNFDLEYWNQ
jgi:hypothetical protein